MKKKVTTIVIMSEEKFSEDLKSQGHETEQSLKDTIIKNLSSEDGISADCIIETIEE